MTTALSIKSLKKTYGNGFEALKGIDLDVMEGDFFALLGPNGAGKSTAIGIITTLINKTSGSVEIFGKNIDSEIGAAKSFIGLVPQEFNFNVFEPVQEILWNQAGYYGIPRKVAEQRAERYLKQLDLWGKRKDQAISLSGGMKRRLMIARALVHEPKLLILDEPTAGVDIEIRHSMWKFLQEINAQGTTIILTTHYLEEAENLCRNIAIIDHGQIIENTSIRSLLRKLQFETFVLDLDQPVAEVPEIDGFRIKMLDDSSLEVEMDKQQSVNVLFDKLSQGNMQVKSMRNKSNRLEQLFMHLVTDEDARERRAKANDLA
jgi:ABC-2 type transport system ATP-binding protein